MNEPPTPIPPLQACRRDSTSTMSTLSESGGADVEELDELIRRITQEVAVQLAKTDESDRKVAPSAANVKPLVVDVEAVANLILQTVEVKATSEETDLLRSSMNGGNRRGGGTKNHRSSRSTHSKDSVSSNKSVSSKSSASDASSCIWDENFWSGELSLEEEELPPTKYFSGTRKTSTDVPPSVVMAQSEPNTKARKEVRFDSIVIREYLQCLGDNPACHGGPSLAIGWAYHEHPPLPVRAFEKVREPKRRRKNSADLVLSRTQREMILEKLGYSDSEIAEAVRQGNKDRTHRRQSNNNLGTDSLGLAIQSAARRVKFLWSSKKKK